MAYISPYWVPIRTPTRRLRWRRKNSSEQTMSQCERYWFVQLSDDPAWHRQHHGMFRLWHDDTLSIVGHFDNVSDVKAAAQIHYETMRRSMKLVEKNQEDK